MKNKMPSKGLRLGRDSGSILCDTLKKWRFRTSWGGVILFSLTSQLEKYILISIDKCPTREHYISSTFLAICLFGLLMSIKVEKPSVLSKTGERDTLYIYIFHPLFLWIMSTGFKKMGLLDIYSWIAPFAVLASTMAFIYALRKINVIK